MTASAITACWHGDGRGRKELGAPPPSPWALASADPGERSPAGLWAAAAGSPPDRPAAEASGVRGGPCALLPSAVACSPPEQMTGQQLTASATLCGITRPRWPCHTPSPEPAPSETCGKMPRLPLGSSLGHLVPGPPRQGADIPPLPLCAHLGRWRAHHLHGYAY